MARREEWLMQVKVARLFATWLPADCFWTATDATTTSPTTGLMRKKRGCRAGLPDLLILFRGKLIAVELKSRGGRCSPAQRLTREALIAAGGAWWEARSANAAMWALAERGVTFRMIARNDGTIECWRQPELAPWEVPRRDPAEPRPSAPGVAARRRTAQRRWRERRKAARITEQSAAVEAA
jgi:hypothetical protein